MKELSALSLLFILFMNFSPIYSQDEIKNYVPPKVMEGSSLSLTASPSFSDYKYQNSFERQNRNMSMNLEFYFTKWRFSDKIDYIVRLDPGFGIVRMKVKDLNQDTTLDGSSSHTEITAAIDHYPVKDLLYIGACTHNIFDFQSGSFPQFANSFAVFFGTGKIYDAKMVKASDNFEDILLSEKVIDKKLSPGIRKKLTQLFDKRENTEFISKFKDDNEIEFFSEVETLLKNNGIINAPLGSRAVIKLYRALTDYKFLYFPFYKGYQIQLAGNFYYGRAFDEYEINSYKLKKDISISGIWGIPINNKTELISNVTVFYPIDDKEYPYPVYSDFNNPITIKETRRLHGNPYDNINYVNVSNEEDFAFFVGSKVRLYRYFTNTIGLFSELNYSFGKIKESISDKYNVRFRAMLLFNILNSLSFRPEISFNKSNRSQSFSTSIGLSYYLF